MDNVAVSLMENLLPIAQIIFADIILSGDNARQKWPFLPGISGNLGGRPREVGDVRAIARDHTEEAVETLIDLMRHAKSDAARGAAAQALLDRGYGKSVAVSMDIVDEGQAHLDALQELADRRQRINRVKTPAEAV